MNRTRSLLRELTAERFGPLQEAAREAPPTPDEILRRRRVLLGMPPTDTADERAARRQVLLGRHADHPANLVGASEAASDQGTLRPPVGEED